MNLNLVVSFFLVLTQVNLAQANAPVFACKSIYEFSENENIEYFNLEELVARDNGELKGIYVSEGVFHIKEFKSWDEVSNFYSSLPLTGRRLLKNILEERKKSLSTTLENLRIVEKQQQGKLTFRIKDIESLRAKIFNRIQSYEKKGEHFDLSHLADVIGFRLVLPIGSPLLKLVSKGEWAKVLKTPEKKVSEVEIKGNSEDVKNGRFYSAIHLSILDENGHNFEVQVMTVATALWHKWDHSNVYKPKVDVSNQANLKNYSKEWIKTISEISKLETSDDREIYLIQTLIGLHLTPESTLENRINQLNNYYRIKFNLFSSQGFTKDELTGLSGSIR